ncbi:MAG TPA: hypothetical protein VG929_06795 [Actinomycetota bacterium]|nr:hypothetical protein [Actinomycetota bacterium]
MAAIAGGLCWIGFLAIIGWAIAFVDGCRDECHGGLVIPLAMTWLLPTGALLMTVGKPIVKTWGATLFRGVVYVLGFLTLAAGLFFIRFVFRGLNQVIFSLPRPLQYEGAMDVVVLPLLVSVFFLVQSLVFVWSSRRISAEQ